MLRFRVRYKQESQQVDHPAGAIVFGRNPTSDGHGRCVVHDPCVSKTHVRVEALAGSRVRLENLSRRNPIWLADHQTIAPGERDDLVLPIRFIVGETLVEVEDLDSDDEVSSREGMETIAAPLLASRSKPQSRPSLSNLGGSPDASTIAHWFETIIAVQRAAAGSPELYDQTASAVVDLVGLDRGLILLRQDDLWKCVARAVKGERASPGEEFSHTILRHMVEERRTFYMALPARSKVESLVGLEAVVASPIFGPKDDVVGAVYGSRTRNLGAHGLGIGPLEAQVVQLLASAVGAGLARSDQEAEASRLRVQFEQFFSADLARELQRNPQLLEGQEREVTVLFADIRGFSHLAQRLGAADFCRLVSDVMERFTARIHEFDGVVVDYAGDGLLAMWNAPTDQPDHASRACRAALALLAEMPGISAEQGALLDGPLKIGVGLNTGLALVGNTGSRSKLKYGPQGHAVNLASRVEGATKHLGIPTIITGSTRALLDDEFATRRLGRVRVVGISGAVDLFELSPERPSPDWSARRDAYEAALTHYEAGRWGDACRALHPLLHAEGGDLDIPTLDLLQRAAECCKLRPDPFDPALGLGSK